jgi:hypothetical protein
MSIFLGDNKAYWRKTTMTKKELEAVEVYPKIIVYKNMFKDISKSYKII